jgi:hypothetical protein
MKKIRNILEIIIIIWVLLTAITLPAIFIAGIWGFFNTLLFNIILTNSIICICCCGFMGLIRW